MSSETLTVLAPWGSPPTPLLPRWHIDNLPSVPLPTALVDVLPPEAEIRDIGDLPKFWEHRFQPLNENALYDLVDTVSRLRRPPESHIVIPAHTNIDDLLKCPLRVRTYNSIKDAYEGKELKKGRPVTTSQLFTLRSFGIPSLLDLMCIVEAATEVGILSSFQLPAATPLEIVDSLDDTAPADLTNERSASEEVLLVLTEFKRSLLPLEQQILEYRILTSKPVILEELGQKFNLTRERVRQRQKPLESNFRQLSSNGMAITHWVGITSEDMRQSIDPITTKSELERQIAATFPTTLSSDESVVSMARYLLREELDYTLVGNWYLDKPTIEAVQILKEEADSLADSAGLVNELELRNRIPHENLDQYWEIFLELLGFHRFHGQLSPRDSMRTKAKAALISIGRLATKEEISKICGAPPDRVSSYLSSFPDVVRADKTRWGLDDWIEDEYKGICAEIIQRINEGGGAARLDRLLEELPRKFGVSTRSIHIYAKTSQFDIRGQYIVLADESSLQTRPFESVIHGYTEEGHPYWSFIVQNLYFHGYSISRVPPEIAVYLGVKPNGRIEIPILEPTKCRPISVIWRLTSRTGAEIGYLSDPLKGLNAQVGDRVDIIIHDAISGAPTVSFAFHTNIVAANARENESVFTIPETVTPVLTVEKVKAKFSNSNSPTKLTITDQE